MGRKIPAKKHRGVKDPVVQQARRLENLKTKINAPPKDADEQPVPRSLTRLFSFKEKGHKDKPLTKKHEKVKRLNQRKGAENAKGVGHNPISKLRRLPGESGRNFSLRINSAVRALHNPIENLEYPQDIDTEDVKGELMAEQRERRAKKRKRAKKPQEQSDESQLTRTQRLALKKKEKKIKALQASNEKQEVVYERISFGEVSHAPPALHFKHKKIQKTPDGAPRPGRRDLLLNKLLSGADAERMERARNEAVAAYRALKANKPKNKSF